MFGLSTELITKGKLATVKRFEPANVSNLSTLLINQTFNSSFRLPFLW